MDVQQARTELREAWAAVPLDTMRVARATALLLELVDYDVVAFAFAKRDLIKLEGGKKT